MSGYLISLLVGILVGVFYAFLGVKSPAPPLIALCGLLGMLMGEGGYPKIKERFLLNKHNNSREMKETKNE